MTAIWTPDHLAAIARAPLPELPVIDATAVQPILPGVDLWDFWPVQTRDGSVARIGDGTLWLVLSAVAAGDPVERHSQARLRLLHRTAAGWRDLGPVFAEGSSPGSREWSGSTIYDPDSRELTLFFTAAGRRDGPFSYEQRLFEAQASVSGAAVGAWSAPREIAANDGRHYVVVTMAEGGPGTIKAYRDPGYFRDPADDAEYLLFAGSLAGSTSLFNGCIGMARRDGDAWQLQSPLLAADDISNELERPHIVRHQGLYYLFWSTQGSVFAPGLVAPSGLYGMVSSALAGPWTPLNGSGLVLCNPGVAPMQAFSWLVLDDLSVVSFIDQIGPGRAGFGGTMAPIAQLVLAGDRAQLAGMIDA
ncbi:MAG: glycoside hydrolase 68 family protein [Alphaproteobacteria bacterium PA4]|nr:MAG: glycoside hydrolase 68 family protein [Alphaproteobacteria bacterium PA4]